MKKISLFNGPHELVSDATLTTTQQSSNKQIFLLNSKTTLTGHFIKDTSSPALF